VSPFQSIPVDPAFTDHVAEWCRKTCTPLASLSKDCGLHPSTLSVSFCKIRSGKAHALHIDTVKGIARVTGVRAEALPYGA